MALSPVVLFFAAFALPSSALALLALRSFHRAGPEMRGAEVERARRFQLGAGALPPVLVALATLATSGAPLGSPGFLAYGAIGLALGLGGGWLFRKAAADPRRKWRKAAETAPMVLIMVNLVFVARAWAQAG